MGYLMGAYGKLAAGKRLRSLQARMMRVQSDLRRATRDIEQQEKFFSQQEKMIKNNMSLFSSGLLNSIQQNNMLQALRQFGYLGANDTNLQNGLAQMSQDTNVENQKAYQTFLSNMQYSNMGIQQAMQTSVQMMQTMLENQMEAQRELQLQPLKDYEDELQTEKDSLETQIQLAQQDYDACKEMEKAGAKNLAPQYTGQG